MRGPTKKSLQARSGLPTQLQSDFVFQFIITDLDLVKFDSYAWNGKTLGVTSMLVEEVEIETTSTQSGEIRSEYCLSELIIRPDWARLGMRCRPDSILCS